MATALKRPGFRVSCFVGPSPAPGRPGRSVEDGEGAVGSVMVGAFEARVHKRELHSSLKVARISLSWPEEGAPVYALRSAVVAAAGLVAACIRPSCIPSNRRKKKLQAGGSPPNQCRTTTCTTAMSLRGAHCFLSCSCWVSSSGGESATAYIPRCKAHSLAHLGARRQQL